MTSLIPQSFKDRTKEHLNQENPNIGFKTISIFPSVLLEVSGEKEKSKNNKHRDCFATDYEC